VGHYTQLIPSYGGSFFKCCLFGKGARGFTPTTGDFVASWGTVLYGLSFDRAAWSPCHNRSVSRGFHVEAAKSWMGYIPTWCEPLGLSDSWECSGLLACDLRGLTSERHGAAHIVGSAIVKGGLGIVDGPRAFASLWPSCNLRTSQLMSAASSRARKVPMESKGYLQKFPE